MEAKKVIQIEKYRKHTKNKPKKRLKKKIQNFFFSLFIILIVGSVFYFTSSISKLSMIYFDGLNYVSRSQLIEMTDLIKNNLDIDEKEIIIRHVLEGYSLKEIAKITYQNINTVKSKYRRALLKLKHLLKEKCLWKTKT